MAVVNAVTNLPPSHFAPGIPGKLASMPSSAVILPVVEALESEGLFLSVGNVPLWLIGRTIGLFW